MKTIQELEIIRAEKSKEFSKIHEAYNADQPGVTEADWDAAHAALEEAKSAVVAAKDAEITPERRAELEHIKAEGGAIEGGSGAMQLAAYIRVNRGPAFPPRCVCGGMRHVRADRKSCADCRD